MMIRGRDHKRILSLLLAVLLMLPELIGAQADTGYSSVFSDPLNGRTFVTVSFMALDAKGRPNRIQEVWLVEKGHELGRLPDAKGRKGYTFTGWREKGKDPVDEKTVALADMILIPVYEETMPAATADAKAKGVKVHVDAPAGALPRDASFQMEMKDADDYRAAVEKAMASRAGRIKAIEMSFVNSKKKGVQPQKPVTVQVTVDELDPANGLSVIHIADDGKAEVIASGITRKSFSFQASSFSVYAVAEETGHADARLQVNFSKGDAVIASMLVNKRDADAGELPTVLPDPGAVPLEDDEVFLGWCGTADYSSGTASLTMEQIRDQVKTRLDSGVTDGDSMTYYAMVFKARTVTYLDESSAVICADSVTYLPGDATVPYTVNQTYTPKTQDADFQGWSLVADGAVTETRYANGTELDLKTTGNLVLRAYAPTGYWLSFHENGKGASYTAPQFVKTGAVTERPADPERTGYTFGGWYTDPECTKAFAFGKTLTDRTDVYARWISAETAVYTVILWKQNVDGNGYDFAESISLTGHVGERVTAVEAAENAGGRYARVDGTRKQYEGFYLEQYDENVTIAAEGTSVVNVYFHRAEYTLSFQDHAYTPVTGNTGTQYGLVNGRYQQIYYRKGSWRTDDRDSAPVYSGTRYSQSSGWVTVREIKALFGQNISSYFPIKGNNGITYSDGQRWAPQSSTPYSQVLVYIDIMPAANVVFHLDTAVRPLKTMNYYTEALPGQTADVTYKGRRFVLYNQIKARYNMVTEAEDYIDLVGFAKFGTDPAFVNGTALDDSINDGTINLYYTRSAYQIHFMDGVYTVPGGGSADETNRGEIHTSEAIAYGADISSYAEGGPDAYVPVLPGYAFAGWFADESCVKPVSFSAMPVGGMTVYAKWVRKQYRVFLHPNVPVSDTSLRWGQTNQQTSFRILYGERISDGKMIVGERDDYELISWYTDPACTKSFDFSAFVLNDSTVTAEYRRTEPTELDAYGNPASSGNTDAQENRFWITRKLDLYAKWRSKLEGADGIGLVYSAENGDGAPEDSRLYADQSTAVAGEASTPRDASESFRCWVVQKWDGSAWTDTDVRVQPGDTFVIHKEDARREITEGTEEEIVRADYTIRLRAEYGPADPVLRVQMRFLANGGVFADGVSGKISDEECLVELYVNESVAAYGASDVKREGYTLLGWSVTEGSTEADFAPGQEIAADHLDQADNSRENILYAVWKKDESETIDVTVTKTWDDSDDQDGLRPSEITVRLLADGETVRAQKMTGEGSEWTYTFKKLPRYRDGEEIAYTIAEDAVDGYTAAIDGFAVTNTHAPETIDVTVTKTWDDSDDQDGLRPDEITVRLLADRKTVKTQKMTGEGSEWTYTFKKLPKYRDGKEIAYTIAEDAVDGYTAAIDGFAVTNTHTPETIDVTVTKTWDDNNDQDGLRPDEITVRLLADKKTVKTQKMTGEGSEWTYTFKKLPKYRDGKEISYTIAEDAVEGYTAAIDGFAVTNTHTPETIDITVRKRWDDNDNQDGLRPAEVVVRLLADKKTVKTQKMTGEGSEWTYTFKKLPKYRDGKEIAYTIAEDEVEGYTAAIDGFAVTNTHTPETIDITVRKRWDDNDNQDGLRPAEVVVRLLADKKAVKKQKITGKGSEWSYKFRDLPKYKDGKKIQYTITEDDTEGYTTTISGYTVTNTHTPETIDVTVTKTWDDNDNQDGIRPGEITVRLLADKKTVKTQKMTGEGDEWTYTFKKLPKYRDGKEIAYTIAENAVEGYTAAIDGLAVTNTHTPETVDIVVTKTWDDGDNQDGIRPSEITVSLLADGETVKTQKMTGEGSEWTYTFEELPKYQAGTEIAYSIAEEAVTDYETEIDGFSIVNTHVPLKRYRLTIYYRNVDGSDVSLPFTGLNIAGMRYRIISPKVAGYTAMKDAIDGIQPERDLEFVVLYVSTPVHGSVTPQPEASPVPTQNPGGGQGSQPTATPAQGGGQGNQPTPTPASGGGQGNQPTPTPASGGGQGNQPTPTPASGGGQGNQPTTTPAPGEGQAEQPTATTTPDTTAPTPAPTHRPGGGGGGGRTGQPTPTPAPDESTPAPSDLPGQGGGGGSRTPDIPFGAPGLSAGESIE